jgi:membrane-bound ClpP family serine protease
VHADQIIQILGAVLILMAFIGAQLDRLDPHSLRYLLLNLVGSAVLAILAALDADWGFLLLEGVWALVSGWGLARALRRPSLAAD